jgi:5'-3' exonuclease
MDIDSNVFHSLPTEMQQEILTELKTRSIRPSWYKMDQVIDEAPSAIDFSRLQVRNVVHRRNLFQRLQTIYQKGSVLPNGGTMEKRRIATQKDREYILVRNEHMPSWSMKPVEPEPPINVKEIEKVQAEHLIDILEADDGMDDEKQLQDHLSSIVESMKPDDLKTQLYQKWLVKLPANAQPADEAWVYQVIFDDDDENVEQQHRQTLILLGKRRQGDIESSAMSTFKQQFLKAVLEFRQLLPESADAADVESSGASPTLMKSPGATKVETPKMLLKEQPMVVSKPIIISATSSPRVEEEPRSVLLGGDIDLKITKTTPVETKPQEVSSDTKIINTVTVEAKTQVAISYNQHDQEAEDEAIALQNEAEELEYARFMATVSNQNVEQVQLSLDQELELLRGQRSRHERDADTVTPDMVHDVQMLLGLFGIPYVTAPGEAEAQCASLQSKGLIDGIITDDSDVLLFGGDHVYRNMFNQAKFVECYTKQDLKQGMGLDRDTLIQIAYLVGSDYTEGLEGVGTVMAMEIISEWFGEGLNGLKQFGAWWREVIENTPDPDEQAVRTRLRKHVAKLVMDDKFPDPAIREAYMDPVIDDYDATFQWDFPKFDEIRKFLALRLGWEKDKTDAMILPIIKNLSAPVTQTQLTLDSFLLSSPLQTMFKPRLRDAIAKLKSHQQEPEQESANNQPAEDVPQISSSSSSDEEARPAKKKRSATSTRGRKRGASRPRGKRGGARAGLKSLKQLREEAAQRLDPK